jgi:hypothetical protein
MEFRWAGVFRLLRKLNSIETHAVLAQYIQNIILVPKITLFLPKPPEFYFRETHEASRGRTIPTCFIVLLLRR